MTSTGDKLTSVLSRIATITKAEKLRDQDGDYWAVPIENDEFGKIRPGEVRIRRSDGRISVTGVGFPINTANDALSLAAALVAAADDWDARQSD